MHDAPLGGPLDETAPGVHVEVRGPARAGRVGGVTVLRARPAGFDLDAAGAVGSDHDEVEGSAVAVGATDDPAEADGDPTADTNGTLTLHAEAIGPMGTRKVIEVTVARTSMLARQSMRPASAGKQQSSIR